MNRVSEHISVVFGDGVPSEVRVSAVEGSPEKLLDLAWECLTVYAGMRGISVQGALREAQEKKQGGSHD